MDRVSLPNNWLKPMIFLFGRYMLSSEGRVGDTSIPKAKGTGNRQFP